VPLSITLLLLAAANAARPAAAAAVYALLAGRRPRSGLIAFIAAGALFSTAAGVLVVVGAQVALGVDRSGTRADVVNLLAGVAALGFSAGILRGGVRRTPGRPGGGRRAAWRARLADPSPAVAAAAGMATHLPGLLYLVALNAIVAGEGARGRAVAQVLAFNLVWWLPPGAALGAFLVRPRRTLDVVGRTGAWLGAHDRAVAAGVVAAAGAYLVASGLLGLAT
jgi:hypothetical protein